MSHEEVRSKPTEAEPVTDDDAPSLRDTQPGAPPNMELSRTLPTGAAFHKTMRSQPQIVLPNTPGATDAPASPRQILNAVVGEAEATSSVSEAEPKPLAASDVSSAMSNTPATLPKTGTTQTPIPPPTQARAPALGAATRREFGGPAKLSPREKARRNLLTHTLQMPIAIRPVQPTAAAPRDPPTQRHGSLAAAQAASTIVNGSPAVKPGPGWTSMQRIGDSPSPDPSTQRAQRGTDPMVSTAIGGSGSGAPRVTEAHSPPPNAQEAPSWQQRAANPEPQEQSPRWVSRMQPGDYERTTLPGSSPIRIPALSAREWLFVGLLACASAATLYSLLVDDITPSVEEDTDAITTAAQHVVTPAAEPIPPEKPAAAPQPEAATLAATTEIISDPPHAEVVVGGAVIGNTPTQVVRGPRDADYLLRKSGYEPQLVRVTPHSGKSISITLRPKTGE